MKPPHWTPLLFANYLRDFWVLQIEPCQCQSTSIPNQPLTVELDHAWLRNLAMTMTVLAVKSLQSVTDYWDASSRLLWPPWQSRRNHWGWDPKGSNMKVFKNMRNVWVILFQPFWKQRRLFIRNKNGGTSCPWRQHPNKAWSMESIDG